MLNRILKKSWFIKSIFFVSAFIILLIGGITYRNVRDLSQSSEILTQTYKINVGLEQILSYLKEAESSQRGFIITNNPKYLESYTSGKEIINTRFTELKDFNLNSPTQKNNLKELKRLVDLRIESFDKSFKFSSDGNLKDPNFKSNFLDGEKWMDSVSLKINKMIDFENNSLKQKQAKYRTSADITPTSLYIVLLISLLFMFAAYSKIISDLGKLKSSYDQLEIFKESTNQSQIISHQGNWIWDIDGNSFIYSDNLYRLLGEEPQSFAATLENYLSYVHPEDIDKLREEMEKMMQDEDLPFIYYRIIQKNGVIKHFKSYAKVYKNSTDNRQLLGTTNDISDEIEHYRVLEERNLELENNNKELSAFNYVASHDLQEPLRKILTFLSRLEDKESDKLSKTGLIYIDRIKNASTRMRLLIDDLLQFSRTNKTDKIFEVIDINLLFEGAKQDLAEVISEEKAIITADIFPVINVIPFQIQQLFSNLISNSLRYRAKDRIPEIHIAYSNIKASEEPEILKPVKKQYHKITFTDNGIGFDNEYAQQIFILFNRLHNKDEYSGTGIGLSICKKIVENHHGLIFAHGKLNVGATFNVYLPVS